MLRRITAALASILALGSCLQREPAGLGVRAVPTTLLITADLFGSPVGTVVVEVTAPDIPTPLAFNIPAVNGVASGTITVPAGANRSIALRAYDAGGVVTDTGSATLNIQPGTNPTISILLTPVAGGGGTVITGSFSVSVQPAAVAVIPGDTVALRAIVLDTNGASVAGQVAWATLAPAVAKVVSTGQQTARVTAVGNGHATVVATYGGVAGSATMSVTVPSGGAWPNAPVGWTVVSDYDMHALNDGGWVNEYPGSITKGLVSVITDPTGPLNSTAWQFYYRQGDSSICGSSPGTEYYALGAVKQLYFGFWVKFSSPFSFPPDPEVHAAYAFAQSGQIVLDMERSGDVYFVNELPGSGGTSIPSLRSPSWSLGGWHQVEMLFDYAGTVKTWVDGVLTINATGVHYPSDAGFSLVEISPTWGGCGGGAPAFDSWIWYGHVHVRTP